MDTKTRGVINWNSATLSLVLAVMTSTVVPLKANICVANPALVRLPALVINQQGSTPVTPPTCGGVAQQPFVAQSLNAQIRKLLQDCAQQMQNCEGSADPMPSMVQTTIIYVTPTPAQSEATPSCACLDPVSTATPQVSSSLHSSASTGAVSVTTSPATAHLDSASQQPPSSPSLTSSLGSHTSIDTHTQLGPEATPQRMTSSQLQPTPTVSLTELTSPPLSSASNQGRPMATPVFTSVGIPIPPASTIQSTPLPTMEPNPCSIASPQSNTPPTPYSATSCLELAQSNPPLPSGYYSLQSAVPGGDPIYVYCNMDFAECAGDAFGWTRVAYLNTTECNTEGLEYCPGDCTAYTFPEGSGYGCGRSDRQTANCCSMVFPVHGIPYTRVSGRVHAYQHNRLHGAEGFSEGLLADINEPYVYGVSVTNNGSAREHIWSFTSRYITDIHMQFPQIVPITGEDFFCDRSETSFGRFGNSQYQRELLWDAVDCTESGVTYPCCDHASWFCQELNETSTTDLEVRVCTGEGNHVDYPVILLELYVQ